MKKRKSALKDFTESSLPTTRRAQFKDILKHRYLEFLKLGFFLFLFSLPLIASVVIKDTALISIEELANDDRQNMILTTNLIYLATLFVSLLVLSIGLAGTSKVIKTLIYGEPLFFKDDFIQGIKENWKSFIVIAVVIGLLTFAAEMISALFTVVAIQVIPTALNFALVFPCCYVGMFLCSVYKNNFAVTAKTSFSIYIRYFPQVLGLYLATVAFAFLKYIPTAYAFFKTAILILFILFYEPIAILASMLFQIHVYDENFNKEQFTEYYRKGLYTPEE